MAVETHTAAARSVKSPRQKQFPAIGGEGHIGQALEVCQQRLIIHLEDSAHPALVRATTKHFDGASQPEKDLDRADDQALARAGCPGETVEPPVQLDPGVGNDREVRNVQLAKHSMTV